MKQKVYCAASENNANKDWNYCQGCCCFCKKKKDCVHVKCRTEEPLCTWRRKPSEMVLEQLLQPKEEDCTGFYYRLRLAEDKALLLKKGKANEWDKNFLKNFKQKHPKIVITEGFQPNEKT